jgi:STE24 endopeptidase
MNESRASRYQRVRRRAQIGGTLCGGGMLAVAALTPAGRWLSAQADAFGRGLSGAPRAVLSAAIVGVLLALAWEIAALPAALWRDRTGPGDAAPIDDRLLAHAHAALVAIPVAMTGAIVWRASVALAGAAWWLVAGIALAGLLAVAMRGLPALLVRMAAARPIADAALSAQVGALAARAGVPVGGILEWQVGDAARATALVAGAGRSRRVFIASELVRDWSADEIAVVIAHELAHHRYHDLWSRLALDAATLSAGAAVADFALAWAAPSLGLTGRADLASLPFVALVAGACWIASTPVRHAQSRRHERRADLLALSLTGRADAFAAALRRLGERHLAEERPSPMTRWLFHRHPPLADRLALADAYKRVRP